MCELFGMSSRWPADVTFSLEELAERGGRTGPHRDGWGIAYYDGPDVRLIKEPGSAAESPCIRFIEEQHLASSIVIAHIRRATRGRLGLRNSHPFARELGGRVHVFAHNGDLPGIAEDKRFPLRRFRPIGETDSERAFCALLERLVSSWVNVDVPPLAVRLPVVAGFAHDVRTLGPANFLYSDSETLFAHGHRRKWTAAEDYTPPGLHLLFRSCPPEANDYRI